MHFSYKKPPPTPTSAAPAPAQPEAAAGGGGFEDGPGEEGEEPLAPTVSRQSSSCVSLAASTKQPSGVWTEEEQEDRAGGCCGLSEGAGKEGGDSSGGSRMKDEEEKEDEEMGPNKERHSSAGASYYPTDALIDNHCSICLNEYDEGDSLTLLPICKHVFHDACISVWLARSRRCPLCQRDLSVLGSSSSSGAEGAHLDRPPFGPSTASMTATPMAPRRRGRWRPAYGEGASDGEEEEDDQEQERGRGGGGGNRRVMMTIVNEPAQHPVMRIVAVDVGEDHSR